MHPACAICRGACCETVVIPLPEPRHMTRGMWELLMLRGDLTPGGGGVRLDAPCRHLTRAGKCGIHDDRPQVCRDYKVGGPACRAAVRDRRPPAVVERIYERMREG